MKVSGKIFRVTMLLLSASLFRGVEAAPESKMLTLTPEAIMEALPLALEALEISRRASVREAKHVAALAKRGIAEEPPCVTMRYTMDAGAAGNFVFDHLGRFYIDRRFVTDSEMTTVRKIEAWFRRHFPSKVPKPAKTAVATGALPVFRGFEDARYQEHDMLILATVREFNADKAKWCGGSTVQAEKIPDLAPALVKSHMIEESGGNGARSRSAWAVDPLQVNVPGDWGAEKELVGLKKPDRRNEGDVRTNVRAAVMYLARKGFSSSARPAAERPKGYFDGWKQALRRYNGRRDRTDTDRHYNDEYADKILRRAAEPELFVPIEIKLAAKPLQGEGRL